MTQATDDLSWFFSPEWQAMEDRADADFREGRFIVYDTVDEFLVSLRTLNEGEKPRI